MAELVSAEATIHNLNLQVEELSSAHSLERVRESYDSALTAAVHQHEEKTASLREEMGRVMEQLQAKVCVCVYVCVCICVCLCVFVNVV